jgi:CheY-like chemotaxis protein
MCKILIVEKDAANHALLLAVLMPEGYELLTAEDSEQGLELAEREQPDLILMDLPRSMSNSYDVIRHLKTNPLTWRIPIIALLAHAAPGERDRALDAGCDGCIVEMPDMQALPQLVRLFLR